MLNDNTRILLDDIPVVKAGAISTGYGRGRAVKNAILYSNPATAHFVRAATTLTEGQVVDPINGVLTITGGGAVTVEQFGLIKIG